MWRKEPEAKYFLHLCRGSSSTNQTMSVLKNLPMTRGIFFVVFVLGGVSAQNNLKLSPPSESESQEEIQELLREVELELETKMRSKVEELEADDDEDDRGNDVAANTCYCSGYKCSCCQLFRIRLQRQRGCLYVTYVPRSREILATLTFGSITIFSRRAVPVSRYLPQPICVRAPRRLSRWGTMCIHFTSFTFLHRNTFYGCSKFDFRASGAVTNVDFGCFTLKVRSDIQHANEEELPYLETPAKDPESIHPW